MMSNELKNKIKNELNKALVFFGETDEEILNERIENDVDTLMCVMASSDPEEINTKNGALVGYPIDVVANYNDQTSRMTIVQLVVTKDNLCYVLNSYDVEKPEGWTPDGNVQYKNEESLIVSLEMINTKLFS